MRGPAPSALDIHTDAGGLRAGTRANIASYWRPWLRRRGLALLSDRGVTWGVLGLARMHCTLSTGGIASKSAAGGWALDAFPEHAQVLREALRLRAGDARRSASARTAAPRCSGPAACAGRPPPGSCTR
ncbi:aminoglycoside adenylyltransferase domain-containing protein [Dactylosporangium sp. NPDC049140]|uniref:aminoglycoside adenylyltransferase domain-containing protein n=1 Tax=Dactylosporangium sp. NPDC049140 TaxID=3155647 RepID=UPI0033DB5935